MCQEMDCCDKPWVSVNTFSVSGDELREHPLCARASVVVPTCCVSGPGLLCEPLLSEHLLCDYFLSARLCGILLLTLRGCAGHKG